MEGTEEGVDEEKSKEMEGDERGFLRILESSTERENEREWR